MAKNTTPDPVTGALPANAGTSSDESTPRTVTVRVPKGAQPVHEAGETYFATEKAAGLSFMVSPERRTALGESVEDC